MGKKKTSDRERRNCLNCKWLEWIDDDSEASPQSGYTCNKRDDEENYLDLMNLPGADKKYLYTSKKCFERRAPGCAKCETYADEICECPKEVSA